MKGTLARWVGVRVPFMRNGLGVRLPRLRPQPAARRIPRQELWRGIPRQELLAGKVGSADDSGLRTEFGDLYLSLRAVAAADEAAVE
jgi:hypothetical protein